MNNKNKEKTKGDAFFLLIKIEYALDLQVESPFKMPSKFDELPLDVIKYEILPFVSNDYFARMGINSILQPVERTSTPLRKNAVAELEMTLTLMKYKKKGLYVEPELLEGCAQRVKLLLGIFDFNINDMRLIKYSKNFRDMLKKKAELFANPNINDYQFVSEDEKANVILKATQILEVLAKNPYVCEADPSFRNETWSPIDGLKRRIIDNSDLLEKIRRSKPHWREIEFKRGRSHRYYDYYREYGYFDSDDKWITLIPV